MKNRNELLRSLPKVDECLLILLPYITENALPIAIAKKAVQSEIEASRQAILNGLVDHVSGNQVFLGTLNQAAQSLVAGRICAAGFSAHRDFPGIFAVHAGFGVRRFCH